MFQQKPPMTKKSKIISLYSVEKRLGININDSHVCLRKQLERCLKHRSSLVFGGLEHKEAEGVYVAHGLRC